jgi:type II secretory pathway component PulF
MPAFTFEAVDAQGAVRKGTLDADTARAARSALRAQSLVPLSVQVVGASSAGTGEPIPVQAGSRDACSTRARWRCGHASWPAWCPPVCRWSGR